MTAARNFSIALRSHGSQHIHAPLTIEAQIVGVADASIEKSMKSLPISIPALVAVAQSTANPCAVQKTS